MQAPLFSLIVPVYQVERYLRDCVDSLLAQDTTAAYEIILVDDGSPDRCGAICDEYAAQYENVRVHHKPNGGISSTRNAGLALARGTYVLFIDSDDICDPALLSVTAEYTAALPDLILHGTQYFDETGPLYQKLPPVQPQGESGPAYLQRVFQKGAIPPVAVWFYAYRREFLLQTALSFPLELTVAEDFDFNFSALSQAASVVGTQQPLYRYRIRPGSLSTTPNVNKALQKATVTAKWFRRYPVPPIANSFCYLAFPLCQFGSPAQLGELLQFYRANRDILDHVSGSRQRFGRLLFRLFGFYNGSRLIMALIGARHRLQGIPD